MSNGNIYNQQQNDFHDTEALKQFPNTTAFQQTISIPDQLKNSYQDRMQLYPEKQYELASAQVPDGGKFLGDSIPKLLEAQIESEVKSSNSTSVLNNLITSLKDAVVPGKLNPQTSDGAHVAAEVGVTAARTFSHSLLHIIDDGLVWMDATQVSSAARTNFNMDSFQKSCASLLSGVKRDTGGNFQFGSFWNGLNRVEQIGFVRSLINMYDSNQTQRSCKVNPGCPDTAGVNPSGIAANRAVTQICETLSLATRGAGSSDAWSSQQIVDTMLNSVRSTTESEASSSVGNQITPSFITNWCVYQRLFMRLQQSTFLEGDNQSAGMLGGNNWYGADNAALAANAGGIARASLPQDVQRNVFTKPSNDSQNTDSTMTEYPECNVDSIDVDTLVDVGAVTDDSLNADINSLLQGISSNADSCSPTSVEVADDEYLKKLKEVLQSIQCESDDTE
jgi:hypothetical protein